MNTQVSRIVLGPSEIECLGILMGSKYMQLTEVFSHTDRYMNVHSGILGVHNFGAAIQPIFAPRNADPNSQFGLIELFACYCCVNGSLGNMRLRFFGGDLSLMSFRLGEQELFSVTKHTGEDRFYYHQEHLINFLSHMKRNLTLMNQAPFPNNGAVQSMDYAIMCKRKGLKQLDALLFEGEHFHDLKWRVDGTWMISSLYSMSEIVVSSKEVMAMPVVPFADQHPAPVSRRPRNPRALLHAGQGVLDLLEPDPATRLRPLQGEADLPRRSSPSSPAVASGSGATVRSR